MPPLAKTVECVSASLLALEPGPLAELCRLSTLGTGAGGGRGGGAAYWLLAARCDFLESAPAFLLPLVRTMALLTPKGQRMPTDQLHRHTPSLGAALHDAGVSEQRLARLLALRHGQRAQGMERMARHLARQQDRSMGLNCLDIAGFLLSEDNSKTVQRIARGYYTQLSRAARKSHADKDISE